MPAKGRTVVKGNGEPAGEEPRDRKCLNGLSAATPVKVPSEGEFGDQRHMRAPALDETVQALIRSAKHGLGGVLDAEVAIGCRWVRTGGQAKGKPIVAKLMKCGASLKFESGRDYLVDVSADSLRELGFSHWQLEAALYHELKHIRVLVDSDGKVTLSVAGHDAEVFGDEMAIYGPWMLEHEGVRERFKQAPLFGDVVATFEQQRKAAAAANDATAD
jgi:hypothetical protein